MKHLLHSLTLTSLVLALTLAGSHAAETRKPNIIVILTDDQGYGDFSCHGNPILKTPNMDRLHDEGVRFNFGSCSKGEMTSLSIAAPFSTPRAG